MTDAYVETTILADRLLKPQTLKGDRAREALSRYDATILPVYSIKELKAGPLDRFAWVHGKLVATKSYANTMRVVSSFGKSSYLKNAGMEALAAAATSAAANPQGLRGIGSDKILADRYRLHLASIILRAWDKRRKVTTRVTDELECYVEARPRIGKNGLLDLEPKLCDTSRECCLSARLKARPDLLKALRKAIPEDSKRSEDIRRRQALKQLIKGQPLYEQQCRALGDAIFAFFCPESAVVLTTNLDDHRRLAQVIKKRAESPEEKIKAG